MQELPFRLLPYLQTLDQLKKKLVRGFLEIASATKKKTFYDVDDCKTFHSSFVTIRPNKRERLSLASLYILVICFLEKEWNLTLRGEDLALLANIRRRCKGLPKTNTIAYCTTSPLREKISFKILTPVVNITKRFFFVPDEGAK